MIYSADDLLLEREKRVELINSMLKRFNKPLVFVRVNYPGLNKDNSLTNNILQNVDKVISDIFKEKIRMKLFRVTAEGPTITLILDEETLEIKKTTIDIEDKYVLGRCVDIDVYDNITCLSISRSQFGLEPRKCYLCGDVAHNCIRSGRHDQNEVIKFINHTYADFLDKFYVKNKDI